MGRFRASIRFLSLSMCATCLLAARCGNPSTELEHTVAAADDADEGGQPIEPPFQVRDDVEGLLLVWFDAEGTHTADRRADIPEASRGRVRVDSLSLPPDQRLDADHVYIADLRNPGERGTYPVRKVARNVFERWIDRASGALSPTRDQAGTAMPGSAAPGEAGQGEVVLYGASWCGACRSAAKLLRKRGVAFVEKDIEKDRKAYEEMQRKAKQAGVTPRGVPVIDFRGQLLLGFDAERLERLIAQQRPNGSPAADAPPPNVSPNNDELPIDGTSI